MTYQQPNDIDALSELVLLEELTLPYDLLKTSHAGPVVGDSPVAADSVPSCPCRGLILHQVDRLREACPRLHSCRWLCCGMIYLHVDYGIGPSSRHLRWGPRLYPQRARYPMLALREGD